MRRVISIIICVVLLGGVALSESAWPVFDENGYYDDVGEVQLQLTSKPVDTARPVQRRSNTQRDRGEDDSLDSIKISIALICFASAAIIYIKDNRKKASRARKPQYKRANSRVNRSIMYQPRFDSEKAIRHMMRENADKALERKACEMVQCTHTLEELSEMNGRQFEHFVAKLMEHNGYTDVNTTPASGDYGADVIAVDHDGAKVAIQCKLWQESVGNKAVQEVYAAMAFYDCTKSMVITNSRFTSSAVETAKKTGTILCDKNGLLELMNKAEARENAI